MPSSNNRLLSKEKDVFNICTLLKFLYHRFAEKLGNDKQKDNIIIKLSKIMSFAKNRAKHHSLPKSYFQFLLLRLPQLLHPRN